MLTLPPGWSLEFTSDLPPDIAGLTIYPDRVVWISTGLPATLSAFVLQHELQHVHRGAPRGWSIELEERLCDRLAAQAMQAAGAEFHREWLGESS